MPKLNRPTVNAVVNPGPMKLAQGPMHTDGIAKGSHARGGALARPGRSVGMGDAGGRLPVQNPPTNQVGQKVGQPNPNTSAAASKKPNRKGGAAFYGEA